MVQHRKIILLTIKSYSKQQKIVYINSDLGFWHEEKNIFDNTKLWKNEIQIITDTRIKIDENVLTNTNSKFNWILDAKSVFTYRSVIII